MKTQIHSRVCRMITEAKLPSVSDAVAIPSGSAFGCPRQFVGNRFVYAVLSSRARGLSIGVNMNPDKHCNFDCEYCEVNRLFPSRDLDLDVDVMAAELQRTLAMAFSGELQNVSIYREVPK